MATRRVGIHINLMSAAMMIVSCATQRLVVAPPVTEVINGLGVAIDSVDQRVCGGSDRDWRSIVGSAIPPMQTFSLSGYQLSGCVDLRARSRGAIVGLQQQIHLEIGTRWEIR